MKLIALLGFIAVVIYFHWNTGLIFLAILLAILF